MKMKCAVLSSHFSLQSVYCRYALRLTIGCFITITLYTFLTINNGYWIVFSVVACIWPTLGVSLQRMRQRLVGTFLGIGLGILIAHSFLGAGIYIDFLLPLFVFLMFYLKVYDYSYYVLFVSVVTILFVCLLDPGNWQIAFVRLEMTAVGVVIAFLSTRYLFPVQTSQRMPWHLQQAQHSLKSYFALLSEAYFVHDYQHVVHMQMQTFKQLQIALLAAQESTLELGRLKSDALFKLAVERIQRIYEALLCLAIYLPNPEIDPVLQNLLVPLAHQMSQMQALFTVPDNAACFKINRHLAEFKTLINGQRIHLARDPKIKAAIFHDHIQLTLFIETLQRLLVEL